MLLAVAALLVGRGAGTPAVPSNTPALALSTKESAHLRQEAVERLRDQVLIGFTVIPGSMQISASEEMATVNYMALLANGDLLHVSVIFEWYGGRWRFRNLGTLCCGQH